MLVRRHRIAGFVLLRALRMLVLPLDFWLMFFVCPEPFPPLLLPDPKPDEEVLCVLFGHATGSVTVL
ncbi:MAG: hypothetical protein C7B45_17680 [Sulfobacillus acidophilus]|uniref:Uncharacterized protein n=1 Tax=Sulfobacillus acidophilus TaxID=53633 RepID=A0A2T2WCC6_9FIRM|nr:MAG: hypothetical protein C7B45_17680 [Sulfobacillus acidophilus]